MRANKRQLIILAGAAVLLIIAASLLARLSHNALTFTKQTVAPTVFTDAAAYGNDSLVFSNGRALATYNYQTGASSLLTADDILGSTDTVDQVEASADKRYVLFHVDHTTNDSQLSAILQADGSDSNGTYWWVYDTVGKTFHHLPDAPSIKIDGSKLYTMDSDQDNRQVITTYSLPDGAQVAQNFMPEADDFFIGKGGFLLSVSADSGHGQQIAQTADGTVSNTLFDNATLNNVAPNKRYGLGTLRNGKDRDLVLFDLQQKSSRVIGRDVVGNFDQLGDNSVLYNAGNSSSPTLYLYSASTGKSRPIDFPHGFVKNGVTVTPTLLLSSTAAIVQLPNAPYLAGTNIAPIKTIDPNYDKLIDTAQGPVEITYYPDQNAFIVSIRDSSQCQAVYNQLRKDGYDPDLLQIRFSLFTPPSHDPNSTGL